MSDEEKFDENKNPGDDEQRNENNPSEPDNINEEPGSTENNYQEPEAKKIKRLYKSKNNRIIFGVCGGLGEYLELDPLLLRLLFVLSIIFGVWGVVIYVLSAMLIPENPVRETDDQEINSKERRDALRKENLKIIAGCGLILFGLYILMKNLGVWDYHFLGMGREFFIPAMLILTGIYLITKYNTSSLFTFKKGEPEESHKLYRSATNKKIAGVCGGLGEYLGIDPTLVRIFWLLFIFGSFGIGVLIYIIFVIFIPEKNSGIINE